MKLTPFPLPWTHLTISLSLSLGFPTVIVASCHVTWQSCISDIMSSLLGRGNQNSNMKLNLYSNRTRYLLIMFGINMLHRNAMKHPGFWVMIRTESNIITPIFPHPSIWDCRGAFFWSQCSILFRWYQMVSQAQHHQTLQNAWASVWTSQSRRFAEDLRAALPKHT